MPSHAWERTPVPEGTTRDTYLNKSLQRALALLNCFSPESPHLTLRQLSEQVDVPRATVYRLASNLIGAGLMRYDERTSTYSLGLRLLELAAVVLDDMNLPATARPHMEALRETTNETVQLGIMDGLDVVYVAQLESPQPIKLSGSLGSRWPMVTPAIGRALLIGLPAAEVRGIIAASSPVQRRTDHTITEPDELLRKIDEARSLGYTYDDQETDTGLRCLAAPVRDHTGRVVAALGISGPSFRLNDSSVSYFANAVREAAGRVSAELGYSSAAVRGPS